MRTFIKRCVSLLLSVTLLASQLPLALAAEEETEPTPLAGSGITLPDDAEGTFLAFAANGMEEDTPLAGYTLEEHGRYALTVCRAGELDGETSVDLRTIDVSATYGRDYCIRDSRYETAIFATGGTLMEQYSGDASAEALAQETLAEMETAAEETPADEALSTGEYSDGAQPAEALTAEVPAIEAPAVDAPGDEPPADVSDKDEKHLDESITLYDPAPAGDAAASGDPEDGVSELARMKEEQTGLASRETYDTELLPMDESLISYLIPDLGSAVEVSSVTRLVFAPGESEKTVVFEILEDDVSEGSEAFTLTLSDAEGAAVFLPSVMNVSIRDDEPIEHSSVSFSGARFTAGDGVLTVTVERSGAEYSLVTARVRAVETGSAEQGKNFAATDVELVFEPYVLRSTIRIPVKGDQGRETDFALELYDLRGGGDGAIMSAAAIIPAASDGSSAQTPGGGEDATAVLLDDGSVRIPGFGAENFALVSAGNDTFKIMDTSRNPWQEVGIYVRPTDGQMHGWNNYGDSPSTWSNGWSGDHRTLKWYSRLSWEEGGTRYVTRVQHPQNYQQLFLDYSTDTGYSSNKHGFSFNVWGPGGTITTRNYQIGGRNGREVRGAQVMYADALDNRGGRLIEQHGGKLIAPCWEDDPSENYTTLTIYAEKTAHGLIEPDMNVYGYLAMYRQYRVSVEQPDALPYIDIGSGGEPVVVERRPANVYLAQGHNVRYPYQQIGLTETALNPGDPVGGTLAGYYIKIAGTEGEGYFCRTKSAVIDLDDGMMRALDEYARSHWNKTESVMKKDGGVYYMDLTIQPVYEKTYVTVKVTPSADGAFKWGCLDPANTDELGRVARLVGRTDSAQRSQVRADSSNGTISGLFAVGDRLNLDASPAEDCFYTACHYEGFKNPGDTVATVNQELNQHGQMTDWKVLRVLYSRTELAPRFTRDSNRIEVRFENGAEQYFYLPALTTEQEKAGKYADQKLLRIDDSFSGDHITPVLGHAYTLGAVPSAANDGTVRPVFTLADGTKVNGWAVDVIAKYTASQNVITVGWEKYDPDALRYYAVEGFVRYETVTVRQSSQGLKNEPAREVLVTAGGEAIPSYTRSRALGYTVLRQSASTDVKGRVVINGVRAIPGDRISVLISDNGVVQAEYRRLPATLPEETRIFAEQRANHTSRTNEIARVTEKCLVADLTADRGDGESTPEPIRLPVVTGYIPYVTDVRFSLNDHTADGRNNTVPIYAGDSVTLEADVSIPQLGGEAAALKAVRFVIYDKDGALKDSYETTRKTAAGGEALNTWQIAVPYTPPQDWPYQALSDGDRVYVQIVGPDRSIRSTVTDSEGRSTQETTLVETPYALLNTALSFYTPVEDAIEQSYGAELDKPSSADLIGTLAGTVDTGQIVWNKEYDDPKNMATSNYVQYFGIALGTDNDRFGGGDYSWGKMKELLGGGTGAMDAEKSFSEKWNENKAGTAYQNARSTAHNNIQQRVANGEIDQAKADKLKSSWDKGEERKFMDGEKKNSLAAFSQDKQQIGGEIKVVCAWQWVYNKELNTHEQWGYAFSLTFTGFVSRTFYTVYVIPFYLNIDAKLSYNYEGGEAEPAQKVYAKDFARQNDLSEYDNSDYGWHTISVDGKIAVGAGIYGIVGARGTVKFGFAGTWAQADGWAPSGGVSFELGGGFGVDLFLTSVNMDFMIPAWTTGYYSEKPVRKEALDGSAALQSADDWARLPSVTSGGLYLKAFDPGSETFNAIEDGSASLQSVLVPKREETIIDGSMQYVRPRVVDLDTDTFLVFFLQNKAGTPALDGSIRTEANAATLVYAVFHVDEENRIHWDHDTGTVIVDNDGLADTTPAVLRIGDSVYVAWATGDAKDAGTVSGAKAALSDTGIMLQKFDITGKTVEKSGETITVCDDGFQNTNPRLVEENGALAVYYFKQDLTKVEKIEDLVNFTGNYSSYARRLYSAELEPLAQSGNGAAGTVALGADQELLIRLPGDAMTADFTVETYTAPNGKSYRLAAYTTDLNGRVESGDDLQIWLQIQNMTDGRSYHPILLDHGENANLQLNRVSTKTQSAAGGEVRVTPDVFMTWVSDSTCFNTLSFNDLLRGLQEEPGSLAALESLTDAEAAGADWAKLAYERAGGDPEQQPTLCALAAGEPVFHTRDFGENMPVEGGGTVRGGGSLSKYVLVSGDDGNTYLAWTESSGAAGSMGNELVMSSYFSFNKDLRESITRAQTLWEEYDIKSAEALARLECGDESAELPAAPIMERPEKIPFEGWSDPVEVTDFRLTMTNEDRNTYDGLLGKEHSEQEAETFAALGEKYSRGIDELAVVISQDSGALLLANTFHQSFDETNARYEERAYKLSAIRCVPDTSLEIESFEIDSDEPLPGEEVSLSWELINDGLLPATAYRLRITAAADGGSAEEIWAQTETEPAQAVYPGGTVLDTLHCTVPEFRETLVLTLEVTEQNPAAGNADFETTNRETLTITRGSGLSLGAVYGYPAVDYAEKALVSIGDDDVYLAEQDEAQIDPEYLALLTQFGDAAGVLNAYNKTVEPDAPGPHRTFCVFVPAVNSGSDSLTDLKIVVTNEDSGREMGSAAMKQLGVNEQSLTPLFVPVRLSEFGELGVVEARVTVYDGNGTELDTVPVLLQIPDNIRMDTAAVGENAGALTVVEGVSDAQLLYQTFSGDSVIGTDAWKDLASDDPSDRARRIDLKVGESIRLESTAFPYDSLKKVDYYDASAEYDETERILSVSGDGTVTALAPGKSLVYAVDVSERVDALLKLAEAHGVETGEGFLDDITSQILINQILVVVSGEGESEGGGGSGGSGESRSATVTRASASNGSFSVSDAYAKAGERVSITPKADEGFTVSAVTVTDKTGAAVPVTENADGSFSFTMPEKNRQPVKAAVTFRPAGSGAGSTGSGGSGFADVPESAYFADAVSWAVGQGITNGSDATHFSPNAACTRAQMVTFLWRCAGSPEPETSKTPFADVTRGSYYEKAVAWAVENGITNGVEETHFAPNRTVTRGQTVTFLYRFAQADAAPRAAFEDVPADYWCAPAVTWAVDEGITNGVTATRFAPAENCTRAQIVTFLHRAQLKTQP